MVRDCEDGPEQRERKSSHNGRNGIRAKICHRDSQYNYMQRKEL